HQPGFAPGLGRARAAGARRLGGRRRRDGGRAVSELLSPAELEARLRAIGAARYHDRHPFHGLLHCGALNRGQIQAWALNRFYYQSRIPMKDAALIARTEDRELRRLWRQRLVDHDGEVPQDGGIERWLKLTDALGLGRDDVLAGHGILP